MRYTRLVLTLGLLLSVGLACEMPMMVAKPQDDADEPRIVIPVEATWPTRRPISAYYETTATVTADKQLEVTSENFGKCMEVLADEGDTIRRGQVLVELDKEEALVQLRRLDTQVHRNRIERDRAKLLYDEGIGPKMDYENAEFNYRVALDDYKQQQVQLEKMTIKSPMHGLLTVRSVEPGMVVSSGAPVFTVVDPSSYILELTPSEREMSRLKVGQKAKVFVDLLGGEEFSGEVAKIHPSVDPASGTVRVTLVFDSETRKRFKYGAFARVQLVLETHEKALLVPKDAIVEEDAREYLFVLAKTDGEEPDGAGQANDDVGDDELPPEYAPPPFDEDAPFYVAQRVEVETGLEDSDWVEIVEGVDEAALIVTLGQRTLKPGSEVKLTKVETELYAKVDMSAEEALEGAKAEREAGARNVDRRRHFR